MDSLVKNGTYFPKWAASKVFLSISKPTNSNSDFLITERQKKYLQLSISEMIYKEIAEKSVLQCPYCRRLQRFIV